MLHLPNGCSCSTPSIHPKNWKQKSASAAKDWYLQYYFKDPEDPDKEKYPYGRLKIFKGNINKYFKTTAERQAAIVVLERELLELLQSGYNPITGITVPEFKIEGDIQLDTKFVDALELVYPNLDIEEKTKKDIKCILRGVRTSATKLNLLQLPISMVEQKHVKAVLDNMKNIKPNFSNDRYNKYRSYLMTCFDELKQMQIIKSNPLIELKKRKAIRNIRQTPTDKEMVIIDEYLKRVNYKFWRFIQIFFYCSSRETEMMLLQVKNVDLERQRFRILVKKGSGPEWQWRTISDAALPLWIEQIGNAGPEDYVFSKNLQPGPLPVDSSQITRRWKTWVKKRLGITADCYSLKHKHSTKVVNASDDITAARFMGHKSLKMVHSVYDTNHKDREHDFMKKLPVSFAG